MHLMKLGLLPAPNAAGLAAMANRKAARIITQAWALAA